MEGRHNQRIWNWTSCVEIKPLTIHLAFNGSLGRNATFVLVPVAVGSFQATSSFYAHRVRINRALETQAPPNSS